MARLGRGRPSSAGASFYRYVKNQILIVQAGLAQGFGSAPGKSTPMRADGFGAAYNANPIAVFAATGATGAGTALTPNVMVIVTPATAVGVGVAYNPQSVVQWTDGNDLVWTDGTPVIWAT